ncbi:MAG: NAD binding domain of 6-phosphogluconate dehydrogenase-domain-containing protein [Monoraphidium minutum]|nr:MAG: NAD binding domain of 6-phosphogluconate dehydrogenase-domain-containing protein [Monoraphidium minutum]
MQTALLRACRAAPFAGASASLPLLRPAGAAGAAAAAAAPAAAFTTARPPAAPVSGAAPVAAAPAAVAAAPRPAIPQTIGFVGVGNMGSKMATCLMRAGHRLLVADRNPAAVAHLESLGARAVASPREIAETPGVSVVLTMLPSTEHVRDAFEGPDGVLRAASLQPPLLVDCSTVSPLYTQELSKRIAAARLAPQAPRPDMPWAGAERSAPRLIDAPVSGGVLAAANAALTFMVGGPAEAVAAARPLLEAMGTRIIHLGGPGLGHAAKLCNNLCLAIQMAGVSEALALGASLGLEPGRLSEVMQGSSGRCWALECYNPVPGVMPDVPSSKGYAGGFSAQLMLKDLRLAMQLAAATSSPAPMAQNVAQLYRTVVDATADSTPLDFTALYKFVYQQAAPPE